MSPSSTPSEPQPTPPGEPAKRSSVLRFTKKVVDQPHPASTDSPSSPAKERPAGASKKKKDSPVQEAKREAPARSAKEKEVTRVDEATLKLRKNLSENQIRMLNLVTARFGSVNLTRYRSLLSNGRKYEELSFPSETPNAPSLEEWLLDLSLGAPTCSPGVFERSFKMARLLMHAPPERLFSVKGVPDIDDCLQDNLYPMDERGAMQSALVAPHLVGVPYTVPEAVEFAVTTNSMNLADLSWPSKSSQQVPRKLRVLDNFYVCDKNGVQIHLSSLTQLVGTISGSAQLRVTGSPSTSAFPAPVPGIQAFGTLVGGMSTETSVGEVRGRLSYPHRWRIAMITLRLHAVFSWKAEQVAKGETTPDDGDFGLDYLKEPYPITYDRKKKLLVTQKRYHTANLVGKHRKSIAGLMEDKSKRRARLLSILKNISSGIDAKEAQEELDRELLEPSEVKAKINRGRGRPLKYEQHLPASTFDKSVLKFPIRKDIGLPPYPEGHHLALTHLECHQRAAAVLAKFRLPLRIGTHFCIDSLGTIDPRPTYHSERYIYPIGFRSIRSYIDYSNLRFRCRYTSEIKDGGDSGPLFVVTNVNDPLHPVSNRSASGAWSEINHRVVEAKRKHGTLTTMSSQMQAGPNLFLLSSGLPLLLIEGLPGTADLSVYSFQEQRMLNESTGSRVLGSNASAAMNEDEDEENEDEEDEGEEGEEDEQDSKVDIAKEQKAPAKKINPAHAARTKRITKAVSEIVLDLLSNDADAALSLRTIRLRTEAALGLVLSSTEDRKDLRRIVEAVASGNYDNDTENEESEDERNGQHDEGEEEELDEEEDEEEGNEGGEEEDNDNEGEEDEDEDEEESDVEKAEGDVDGDSSAVVVASSSGSKRPREEKSKIQIKPGKNKTVKVTAAGVFNRPFLTPIEDRSIPAFRKGIRLPRVRIHLPRILGCEIVISGPLTKGIGGPVLLLHTPGAAYVISTGTSIFSPSPERSYRLAARPQLQLFEACTLIFHHMCAQSGGTPFRYNDVIHALEKVSRSSILKEFDLNDVHSSGRPVVEDYLITNVADIQRVLHDAVASDVIAKGSAAETARNNLLLALEFKKEVRLRSPNPRRIQSLLDGAEVYALDPKNKRIIASLLEVPNDADILARSFHSEQKVVQAELIIDEPSMPIADLAPSNQNLVACIVPSDKDLAARPMPGPVFEPSLVPPRITDSLIEYWTFFQVYARPLGLSPVKMDDFAAAFVSPFLTGIVSRSFIALLAAIVQDRRLEPDFFYGSNLSPGTWQEYLRILIEDCISPNDKSKLSLLLAARGDQDDSSAMSLEKPDLGPILSFCKESLDVITSDMNSNSLRTPILNNEITPDMKQPYITLTNIEERLFSGFYGTFIDSDLTLKGPSGNHLRRLLLPPKDGGVSGGASAAPLSGYRGFLCDIRLMFANYKAVHKHRSDSIVLGNKGLLQKNEHRSFGNFLDLVPYLFEDNVSLRLLPAASAETSRRTTKTLNDQLRQNPSSPRDGLSMVALSNQTSSSSPTSSSTTLPSSPSIVDCVLALREKNFSQIPIELKMATLAWVIEKVSETRLIRAYTDAVAEAEFFANQTLAGSVASRNKGDDVEPADYDSASTAIDFASRDKNAEQQPTMQAPTPRATELSIIEGKKRVLELFAKTVINKASVTTGDNDAGDAKFIKLAEQASRIDPSLRNLAAADGVRPFLEALKIEEAAALERSRRSTVSNLGSVNVVSGDNFAASMNRIPMTKPSFLKSAAQFFKAESSKGSKKVMSMNLASHRLLSTRLNEIGHDRFGRRYFLLDDIGLNPSVARKDMTVRTSLRVLTLDPRQPFEGLRAFSRVEDIQKLADWLRGDIYSERIARESILSALPSLSKRIKDSEATWKNESFSELHKNPSLALCSFLFQSVSEAALSLLTASPTASFPEDNGDAQVTLANENREKYVFPHCSRCDTFVSNKWIRLHQVQREEDISSSSDSKTFSAEVITAFESNESNENICCLNCYLRNQQYAPSSLSNSSIQVTHSDNASMLPAHEPASPLSQTIPLQIMSGLNIPRSIIKDAKLPSYLRCFPTQSHVKILPPSIDESAVEMAGEIHSISTRPSSSESLMEVAPLQLFLLRIESRLCSPRLMSVWRYSKQRHVWRVTVATAGWNNFDLHSTKNESQSLLFSSSISPPVSFASTIQHELVEKAHIARLKTLKDALLLLEEEVISSAQNPSVPSGIINGAWKGSRLKWRSSVLAAKTEARLYLLVGRFSVEAIDYDGFEEQLSDITREEFLSHRIVKGDPPPVASSMSKLKPALAAAELESICKLPSFSGPPFSTDDVIGMINSAVDSYNSQEEGGHRTATASFLTEMGNNLLFGSALSAFIPKTGDKVVYYGEGFAEAIDDAKRILNETDGSASSKALNRTGNHILSQCAPIPGTAICRVGRLSYHRGERSSRSLDSEPYARITLHVEKWLHSAPAEIFSTVVPNHQNADDSRPVFGANFVKSAATAKPSEQKSLRAQILEALSPESIEILDSASLDKDVSEATGLQMIEAENGQGSAPSGLVIQEASCACCGSPGDVLGCDFLRCGRFYHFKCIGFKSIDDVPETYVCPAHSCADCGTALTEAVSILNEGTNCAATCISCPTSYCVACFNRVSSSKTIADRPKGTSFATTASIGVWSSSTLPNGLSQWQCQGCSGPVERIKLALRRAVSCMRNQDTFMQFTDPVDERVYTDYFDKIGGKANGMSISQLDTKIEGSKFNSLCDFLAACKRIITNVELYSRSKGGKLNYLVMAAKNIVFSGLRQICDEATLFRLITAYSELRATPKTSAPCYFEDDKLRLNARRDLNTVASSLLAHFLENKNLTGWQMPSDSSVSDVVSAILTIKSDESTSPEVKAIADSAVLALESPMSTRPLIELNVVVRLRALTSDFIVPLDRYLAVASHKFTINEDISSFRVSPPPPLTKFSGGHIAYHPVIWKKILTISETICGATTDKIDRLEPVFGTRKKAIVKPTAHNKRKALDSLMASLTTSMSGLLETQKPFLRNGKIYFGRVAGSLVLASPPRNCGELTSARNLALRYCAVPWKSLLVHWCDLSVHTELTTTLSSLWQARLMGFTGSVSSLISKCIQRTTHRVNPWDLMESFKEEKETETAAMQLVDEIPIPAEVAAASSVPTSVAAVAEKKEGEMDETEPE